VIQKLNHFRAMASFVNINGAVLAYEISSDDATKPLLITLHGGRGFGM
jgi:proline iminopeptidase